MLGHRKLEASDYLAILKRRGLLILASAAVFSIGGTVYSRFVPPKYTSQTLVLIEDQKVPGEYVTPVIATNLDSRLASMKEQILSRSRIQPIIEQYHLDEAGKMTMDDRIDSVRKGIEIKPIHSAMTNTGGLPGFFITFTTNDAHTAQLVCGEITRLFLNENLKSRQDIAEGTTDFLKGQLADAKRTLDDQGSKLAAFQRQYFGKLPGEESANLNMLTSLNTQLEAATQQLSRMQQDKSYEESMLSQQTQMYAGYSSANSAGGTTGNAAPLSPAAQLKQAQLTTLQAREQDLLTQYTPGHPDVVTVRRQIADLKRQIAALAVPAVTASGAPAAQPTAPEPMPIQQLKAQIRAVDLGIQAKKREQEQIQNSVRMYQDRIQSSPQVEEQYKELTRDNETAQKFYDDLQVKMNHSKMATDLEKRSEGEQFKMMDAPNLPDSPTSPKVALYAAGGLVFGLALALAISGYFEYKDTALRSERDVWAFTRLPTLAVISVAAEFPEENPKPQFFARFKRKKKVKPDKAALAEAQG